MGAELAIHGYDHVDFRSLSPAEATRQFLRAAEACHRCGIHFEGFRCPYLSYADTTAPAIPAGMFKYSSNKAIWWNVVSPESINQASAIFGHLHRFYQPESSEAMAAIPRISGDLLEIPLSVPDDLQLYDGLKLGEEGIRQAWTEILHRTHRRGEVYVIVFHPESFEHCAQAFESVLRKARLLWPAVWVAQLRDVSRWWWEKSRFAVNISSDTSGLQIRFDCSERATVLVRNIQTSEPTRPWDGSYQVLGSRSLHVPADQHPFVGVAADTPSHTIAFLKEQGYIVDSTQHASRCSVYLDAATMAQLETQVQLIDYIESRPVPLARYWRWPDEARSALCITGDLDALSLIDYASRLFTR
jgi:peptidoglycan/xylan/chitin deacetylase (PgdA/CDA1 family)